MKSLGKEFTAFILCAMLAIGCTTYVRYGPTVFELAERRAVPVTNPDGTTTTPKLQPADIDVLTRANTVVQLWEKKDTISYGYSLGTALTQAGLGFVPSIVSLFVEITPLGPLVNASSTLLGKLAEVISPNTRSQAYADGKKMIMDGLNTYYDSQRDAVPTDKLTDAGRILARRVDCAIFVVENALSQRTSNVADVSCATGTTTSTTTVTINK